MNSIQSEPVSYSVIVPVGRRQATAEEMHPLYRQALDRLDGRHELIYVLDGPQPEFAASLRRLLAAGERFTVLALTRPFGESTAIMAAFGRARGRVIITLPAYHQIEAADISKLVEALQHNDIAIGRRSPRAGGWFERLRRATFHSLLARVTHLRFHDLACGARAFIRQVLEEVHLYGDQQRFLAVLADRQGFRVSEVDLRQSAQDRQPRIYTPREYASGLLDIFTVFFLVRFTKKPLRFFGTMGLVTFGLGAVWTGLLIVQRIFFAQPLADRPALLLSSLLLVVGLQLFALGLLGELIIFTHARNLKDYQVAEVLEFPADAAGPQS